MKNKKIELKSVAAHLPGANPAIRGRAPSITEIRFTPQELFGAMARCSHLHPVDPGAVTFESEGCRYLIAQHVDDEADDFFIRPSVKRLKDFSRTHLIGVIGAGIAYLQMIRDGYVWCDHFENLTLSSVSPTKRNPDFVFNQPGQTDVAITESKATHGSSRRQFGNTVRSGYLEQVDPYLGLVLSGAVASHGFSIGAWMTSATCAELLIDHTAQPVSPGSQPEPSTPTAVRRGNYLTVLSLMFGPAIATAARDRTWPTPDTELLTVRWLDRDWLLGSPLPPPAAIALVEGDIRPMFAIDLHSSLMHGVFALELNVARVFFRSLLASDAARDPLDELPQMDETLVGRAREAGGAVYPDGFAVLAPDWMIEKVGVSQWVPQKGEIAQRIVLESESLEEPTFAAAVESEAWMREEESEEPEPLRRALRESN